MFIFGIVFESIVVDRFHLFLDPAAQRTKRDLSLWKGSILHVDRQNMRGEFDANFDASCGVDESGTLSLGNSEFFYMFKQLFR